jgi:hypothetical protein
MKNCEPFFLLKSSNYECISTLVNAAFIVLALNHRMGSKLRLKFQNSRWSSPWEVFRITHLLSYHVWIFDINFVYHHALR